MLTAQNVRLGQRRFDHGPDSIAERAFLSTDLPSHESNTPLSPRLTESRFERFLTRAQTRQPGAVTAAALVSATTAAFDPSRCFADEADAPADADSNCVRRMRRGCPASNVSP